MTLPERRDRPQANGCWHCAPLADDPERLERFLAEVRNLR